MITATHPSGSFHRVTDADARAGGTSCHSRIMAAQGPIAAWRAAHERQIVDELMAFVALPNVAGNDADMRKNADHAAAMFRKRGFTVETSEERSGSPVVFARSMSRSRAAH